MTLFVTQIVGIIDFDEVISRIDNIMITDLCKFMSSYIIFDWTILLSVIVCMFVLYMFNKENWACVLQLFITQGSGHWLLGFLLVQCLDYIRDNEIGQLFYTYKILTPPFFKTSILVASHQY